MNINNPEISIILPCLNEELALGQCLDQIKEVIQNNNLKAEIIVVDNNSTDKSTEIAKNKGAKLVFEQERGYGSAYLKGFKSAQGKYLFLADPDASYDFKEIPKFIYEVKNGSDFVIGNRFAKKMERGTMPWLRKYIGNPLLSTILRLSFKTKIKDIHCGMRAISKQNLNKLNLKTSGMELASEMIIQAIKNDLKIKELPINYYKRKGKSKLRTFRDGFRHLAFIIKEL